jgi:hypothetical protein
VWWTRSGSYSLVNLHVVGPSEIIFKVFIYIFPKNLFKDLRDMIFQKNQLGNNLIDSSTNSNVKTWDMKGQTLKPI